MLKLKVPSNTYRLINKFIWPLLFCGLANAEILPPANATKIFDDSFESAGVLHYLNGAGNYIGDLRGGSWGNPNTFPNAFPHSRQYSYMNYLVSSKNPDGSVRDLSQYITNYVGTDVMPWGTTENVMVMRVKYDDVDLDGEDTVSRVQYNWFPEASVKDVYMEYLLKLQDNLAATMVYDGVSTWRDVMEFRELPVPGANQLLRAELSINRKLNSQGGYDFGWQGNVSYLSAVPGVPSTFASVPNGYFLNTSAPIPQGQWFKLMVHYKLADYPNGVFEAGIKLCSNGSCDGNQIQLFSFKNIKTATTPLAGQQPSIDFMNFMKDYAAKQVIWNGHNVWQYIYAPKVWVVF